MGFCFTHTVLLNLPKLSLYFLLCESFFFVFFIEFGETKQEEIAFVATTLKALLSVAKTNGRFSGRQLDAGYIRFLFLNVHINVFSHLYIKKCANRSQRTKTQIPVVAKQTIYRLGILQLSRVWNLHFIKFITREHRQKRV